MLTYAIIVATAAAGALHMSWWAALVGATLLALTGVLEFRLAPARRSLSREMTDEPVQALSAFLNGSAAGAAAFLLGRASVWIWIG